MERLFLEGSPKVFFADFCNSCCGSLSLPKVDPLEQHRWQSEGWAGIALQFSWLFVWMLPLAITVMFLPFISAAAISGIMVDPHSPSATWPRLYSVCCSKQLSWSFIKWKKLSCYRLSSSVWGGRFAVMCFWLLYHITMGDTRKIPIRCRMCKWINSKSLDHFRAVSVLVGNKLWPTSRVHVSHAKGTKFKYSLCLRV